MLSLATPAVAASTPPPSDPGSATAPLLGTTAYRVVALGESQIRVGILAVARIPHGTAVYYAVAPNSTGDADVVFMHTKSLNDPFPVQALANLAIVDVAHDAVYQPLISGERCLSSSAGDLSGTDANGTPSVGYAILPELPTDLSSVTIRMGGYAFLPGIPVGDAPPTGPVAAAPVPLGSWPELPTRPRSPPAT
ncbi:hypothetical protein [Microbacterium elymi]|uniref:Uncharacterized protein n=1 Tax=Microbacterium elymi TaxID=2909587 RepID=A0ABY5NMC4_9MICO|nr:hypothetical protein [Microbacterium elymi]UUT36348.1 hypothetical protein L2X98_25770 [Microbacterium elymi]